jgi:hypothetical protein
MNSLKVFQNTEDSQDLSAGALSLALAPTKRDMVVHMAAIHTGSAVSQTATVKLTSPTGANYTFLLDTSSLSSATDYVYNPGKPILVPVGWTLTLALTNSGTPSITAYADILYQER